MRELKLNVFPNPAKQQATIEFNLPQTVEMELSVYDIQGRKIEELYNGISKKGENKIVWDTKQNPGVYIIKLTTPLEILSCRIVVVK